MGTIPDVPYEDVTLTTADGITISGWYVAGTQPNGILHQAQIMFESAQEPKTLWVIDGMSGHNNPIYGHELEYKERVLKFFENAFESQK